MNNLAEMPVLNPPAISNGVGFRHSEQFAKLADSLVKAQGEFATVKKDSDNPYYNAKYADLNSVIDATRPALVKHGIAVIQSPRLEGREVVITTLLLHNSGEWLSDDLRLPGEGLGKDSKIKFDAQTVGSAITYGRRYAYQSFLGIAAEDDDGNAASGHVRQPERKKSPQTLGEARNPNKAFISSADHTKFWGTAKRNKKTQEQVSCYLRGQGIESSTMIPRAEFDKHLEWARNGA